MISIYDLRSTISAGGYSMPRAFPLIDILVAIATVNLALLLSVYPVRPAEKLAASTNRLNKTTPSSFHVWKDGTAFVSGKVDEHVLRCKADGACYLRLHVDNTEVRVVYDEGHVRHACANNQSIHAQSVQKGDAIHAFGAYSKRQGIITISTCASEAYFVRHAGEGTPVGPVTERFFKEVDRLKDEAARKQFEQAKRSGQWETYKDEQLGYGFSYPATWQSPQTSLGAPWSVTYHDFSKTNSDSYTLGLGYISQAQEATMGIDFCTANPTSSRCESKPIGKVTASIDWGDDSHKAVFVRIPLPKGGVVTLTLEPNTAKAKSLFLPILNTFKVN